MKEMNRKDSPLKAASLINSTRSPSPKSKADLQKKLRMKMQNREEMDFLKSQPLFLDKQGIPDKIQKNMIKDNLQKRIKLKMMQKGEAIPSFQVPNESKRDGGFRSISPNPPTPQFNSYQQPTFIAVSPPMGMPYQYGMNYPFQVPQPIRWSQQFPPQYMQAMPQYQQQLVNQQSPVPDAMMQNMGQSPPFFYQEQPFQQFMPDSNLRLMEMTPQLHRNSSPNLSISVPANLSANQNASISPNIRNLLSPNASTQLFGLDNQQINSLFPNGILSPTSLTSQLNAEMSQQPAQPFTNYIPRS